MTRLFRQPPQRGRQTLIARAQREPGAARQLVREGQGQNNHSHEVAR